MSASIGGQILSERRIANEAARCTFTHSYPPRLCASSRRDDLLSDQRHMRAHVELAGLPMIELKDPYRNGCDNHGRARVSAPLDARVATPRATSSRARIGCTPSLAAILVGDDPASRQYVRTSAAWPRSSDSKAGWCAMTAEERPPSALLEEIAQLNADASASPVSCCNCRYRRRSTLSPVRRDRSRQGRRRGRRGQRERLLSRAVGPLHPVHAARRADAARLLPVPVDGARAAVIGRSDIAGKPMALILGGRMCNATVTWCHRHTRDLAAICREADIVVSVRRAPTPAGRS